MQNQVILTLDKLLQLAFIEPDATALWAVIKIDIAKNQSFHRNSAIGTKTGHDPIVVVSMKFRQGLTFGVIDEPLCQLADRHEGLFEFQPEN